MARYHCPICGSPFGCNCDRYCEDCGKPSGECECSYLNFLSPGRKERRESGPFAIKYCVLCGQWPCTCDLRPGSLRRKEKLYCTKCGQQSCICATMDLKKAYDSLLMLPREED